jgi:hypothetical protein
LGRHRTIALLVALGATAPAASRAAAEGDAPAAQAGTPPAPRDAAAPAPSPRPAPPAPPRKYLEAGIDLFNNKKQYDLASRYFQAAHQYRDRLTEKERYVLDVYREKLDEYFRSLKNVAVAQGTETPAAASGTKGSPGATAAPTDAGVVATSTVGAMKGTSATDPLVNPGPGRPNAPAGVTDPLRGPATGTLYGTESWRGTADPKQKARWLLQVAREQILKKHFDLAEQAVAEARALNVHWTVFDQTPDKMAQALEKARAQAAPNGTKPGQTHDRRAARARLRDARTALATLDLDQAEAITREVRSWGVSFGLFDDTPDKVSAAIAEARRRESSRSAGLTVRSDPPNGIKAGTSRPGPADPGRPTEPLPPSTDRN